MARPMEQVRDRTRMVDDRQQRLDRAMHGRMGAAEQLINRSAGKLESLSPLAVLSRGYSVTQRESDRMIVRDGSDVSPGEQIVSRIDKAEIVSKVESVTNLGSATEQ